MKGNITHYMVTTTTLSISFLDNFYYFGCSISIGDKGDKWHYWTDMYTEKFIHKEAEKFGMEVPDRINGAKTTKVFKSIT